MVRIKSDENKSVGRLKNFLEEESEDKELSERYGSRLDLPDDQWIRKPAGMSMEEFYYKCKRDKK